jgi:hypothetical protein
VATHKQIEANRHNALRSTGPNSPAGKSAGRFNALRHGLRARTVVLPGEDIDEFYLLCDELEAEWEPRNNTEYFYLEQMAVARWKLRRMEVGETNIFAESSAARDQLLLLDRLWQAQHRFERSFAKAQRELERVQASRRAAESGRSSAGESDTGSQDPEGSHAEAAGFGEEAAGFGE